MVGLIYLAALILGLGTLALQFVLSHVGGGAEHGDGEGLHLEAGEAELDHGELELGDHGELEVGGHHDAAHQVDAHSASPMAETAGLFLSMRFWTFALMTFGLVGSLLHYLSLAGFALALGLSVASGFASGFVAAWTFRALKGGVSSATSVDDTIGKLGKVTVPVRKGGIGKVRVQVKGQTMDLLATTDAASINPGDEVVVVEFRGEQALVEPLSGREGKRS